MTDRIGGTGSLPSNRAGATAHRDRMRGWSEMGAGSNHEVASPDHPRSDHDGNSRQAYRVLVDRLWPRGITKMEAALDRCCRLPLDVGRYEVYSCSSIH